VTEFRRTTLAEYRNATLDEAVAADLLEVKTPSIPHPSIGTNPRSRWTSSPAASEVLQRTA